MPTYRYQHTFQAPNGDSKDRFVNTFYLWRSAEATAPDFINAVTCVRDLYTYAVAEEPVAHYLGHRAAGIGSSDKIYDMAAAPESPPLYSSTQIVAPFEPESVGQLPEECAVCLSYSALHSGANRPRRRGRVYIGPLNNNAVQFPINLDDPVRVSSDFRIALITAASNMHFQLSEAGWSWRVFSQMDGFGFDIIEVSVDDAFDTQRRRGSAPTSRLSNPVGA